ncbi:hypothetical protein E3T33_12270 [Cryobacterium sp. TMT1-2-1]|uniref:hypothetical protein n=1 Tax=Cryobacterium sp. TMT1-2-1 TaxID=1259232 RepID=UPI0010694C94|nr:hypothetical protein [Cryobacterium sp. TMT1-2-1]TFD42619.1 hypothetical protein E3T33_12270 [Cryobacterium sp. TMT1-2-1]
MRTQSHHLLAVCATVMLALPALAACAPAPTPVPGHTAAATDAPVFASDEEALAAAKKAYAGYLHMSDQILMDGGSGPERIKGYASTRLAELEIESYGRTKAKGLRSTGGSLFSNMTIQSRGDATVQGRGVLTVYLCSDVSEVDFLDSRGQSVVSPSRPDRTPFEVSFDLASMDPVELLVASADVWQGAGIC